MKHFFSFLIAISILSCTQQNLEKNPPKDVRESPWKVLKKYDENHIQRIAMPVGGIGTGSISFNGRGGLQDWEIMNKPAKGFNPSNDRQRAPFFAINVQLEDSSVTRLLEGPIGNSAYEGTSGSKLANHGLPRFSKSTFETSYPFGRAYLTDPKLPIDVTIEAFNPLIPGNVDEPATLDRTVS